MPVTADNPGTPPEHHPAHRYRPDIDGLRAVAVALVVIYHAFPGLCPGGYIGVDVFFVISGFLITGIIAGDVAAGSFSLRDFYARRLRRLGPSLAVVLLAGLGLGFLFLLPEDFRHLAKTAKAAAWFTANIYLAGQQSYWDDVTRGNAMLHTWSLGVEEQFYLLWPLLFIVLRRLRWAAPGPLLLIAALSFGANLALSDANPRDDFYLLVPRIWELAAGALLAVAPQTGLPRSLGGWAGLFGVGCILAAAAVFSDRTLFPGSAALLPVIGAVLVIAAGADALPNRRLLGVAPMRFIGRISYQIYLWHWPLLVIARARGLDAPGAIAAILAVTVILAWLTQHVVERPFRYRLPRLPELYRRAVPILVAALAMVAVLSIVAIKPQQRYQVRLFAMSAPAWAAALWQAQFDKVPFTRSHTCFLASTDTAANFIADCEDPARDAADRRPLIILWGDSHAVHLYPALRRLADRHGFRLAQFTATSCPPVLGFSSIERPHCREINDFVFARAAALRPVEIILSARWNLYDGHDPGNGASKPEALTATLDRLRSLAIGRIVVVGPSPEWDTSLPQILVEHYRAHPNAPLPRRLATHLGGDPASADPVIAAAAVRGGAVYIAPLATLCAADGCLTVVPGSDPVAPMMGDGDHLTPRGAEFLVSHAAAEFLPPDTR